MFSEPSTLATVAFRIAETMKSVYGIDFAPTLEELGIPTNKKMEPGARLSRSRMAAVWREAEKQCGNSAIGLVTGQHVEPRDYYVLGQTWLAATSLKDAVERLIRYQSVLTNAVSEISLAREGDQYHVQAAYPDRERMPLAHGRDLNMSALLKMCSVVAGRPVRPERVELVAASDWHPEAYTELFGCPIRYGCDVDGLWFAASLADAPLPGAMPELLDATERIVSTYIDSFDNSHVATRVRTLLIRMLPSGDVDQEVVAAKLFRSASTLQRQLAAEGTTYRQVVAETRESLAREFLASGKYSAAEVAFMLGFADQSVFSRAFKRWTGMSPGEYQKSV